MMYVSQPRQATGLIATKAHFKQTKKSVAGYTMPRNTKRVFADYNHKIQVPSPDRYFQSASNQDLEQIVEPEDNYYKLGQRKQEKARPSTSGVRVGNKSSRSRNPTAG